MNYLEDKSFTALFSDPKNHFISICSGLSQIIQGIARTWHFRMEADRLDAISDAFVACLDGLEEYRGGSAFNFFTAIALNSFKMGSRKKNPVSRAITNVHLDECESGWSRTHRHRLVDVIADENWHRRH